MALNDDLSCLVISYMDITEHLPCERIAILSALDCQQSEKIIREWWKSSRCEIKSDIYEDCNRKIKLVNTKIHSEDGPAIEWADGGKEWWINGKKHRENGPALVWPNRDKEWWVNGKLHREDGPAIERSNRGKEWYVNGKLHREDGPAIEYTDGYKEWYVNGKRHRENGPAIEYSNGDTEWWINGKHHRTVRPAIEYFNSKTWYINQISIGPINLNESYLSGTTFTPINLRSNI